MPAIIRTDDLCKYYVLGQEKVRALNHVNLEIERGQICCILGTSGSGKSTLLNQLAGLEKPTRGCVWIGKHNISKMSENDLALFRQRHVGFIFQSYNLFGTMTALENTAAPLLYRGIPRSVREKAAAKILREVGLGDRMRHLAGQMSGGQQQRVGIARAFVARPSIVFADEPTGNLDSRTTIEVMELLVHLSREHHITFILVTHDRELSAYADRIVTLKDGVVVGDEPNEPLIGRKEEAAGEENPFAPPADGGAPKETPPPGEEEDPLAPLRTAEEDENSPFAPPKEGGPEEAPPPGDGPAEAPGEAAGRETGSPAEAKNTEETGGS